MLTPPATFRSTRSAPPHGEWPPKGWHPNGEKIIASPSIALDAITRTQATFTTRDLAMFVHRHSGDKDQFDRAMSAIRRASDLIALGKDGRGEDRFTSREMIETEQRLERSTGRLADRAGHRLPEAAMDRAIATSASSGLILSGEQRAAFERVTQAGDLAIVVGYAGTGKSAMLSVARDAWERGGCWRVGAALSGIAAENL
jgi:ATP-dependent exoDNAse (exonuclease V) alpha subunit